MIKVLTTKTVLLAIECLKKYLRGKITLDQPDYYFEWMNEMKKELYEY